MMNLELAEIKPDENPEKEEYASEDCQNLLAMWQDYYPKIGFHPPWVGYFIKDEKSIVGSCAFTGSPVNGKAEISYWTFKEFEGKGIATFACRQLIKIAREANPELILFAKTLPEKNASTRVLEKNGFVYSGIVQDHEIGDAWEWILID